MAERAYIEPPAWRADYRRFEAELLDHYQAICQLCLRPIDLKSPRTSWWGATIDHIVPRARWGGSDDRDNLWVAHFHCNVMKHARFKGAPEDVEAFRLTLKHPFPTRLLERL